MQVVLFDIPEIRNSMLPFSAIRPLADMLIGMYTTRKRWEILNGGPVFCLTESYLEEIIPDQSGIHIYVCSNIIPDSHLQHEIMQLKPGGAIFYQDKLLAFSSERILNYGFNEEELSFNKTIIYNKLLVSIRYPHELVQFNAAQLLKDLTGRKEKQMLTYGLIHQGKHELIIEEGSKIEPCYINTDDGPVFIGKDVFIMAGSQLRGPLAILEGAVVKMGTQIYGGTTIGKHCIVGGEIKNTIMMDYANKAHGGYLGDALIGSWCNLGAGTSCSNLKNTSGEVRVWNQGREEWVGAGLKCGVLMGDYARSAINTSFNTGTVVGTGSQVIADGLTPKYIPDFTWDIQTNERYLSDKFMTVTESWMKFKQKELTEKERRVLLRLLSKH